MFDITTQQQAAHAIPHVTLRQLKEYVGSQRDALLDAALLLGGGPGLRVAQAAIEGLSGPDAPSRRTMREIGRLVGLLKLENVHHQDTVEAERFAMLDPNDPCVEQICLLADELSDLADAYRSARKSPAEIRTRVVA